MEQLTYRFTLDTHKNGSQRTLQGFETGDTLSRRFVISLVEGDKSYSLPLDNVVAVMYTQRPSQSSPSIYDCTIDGNSIIYDVSADDLIEAGTLTCQLKLISGTIANPEKVIVAPRFNVEIWESTTDDSEAEDSQEYTALETALIKAKMCYDARIASFDIANDGTLTVVYGMVDDYRATKEYVADDKVFYNNTAWKCLQTCTGETPEEGDYWTEIPLDEAHVTYTSDYFKDNITPSIEVGTVTEGDTMSVTNSGTALHAVFDFQLVKGDKGDDGFSAVANVAKVGDTATITITDKEGTTTAEITDGVDGQDGQDGADGYSPTATVTKSGDTATITITDKNGTTTETISDGTDGQDGADGYSPTANVVKSGSTATITITDKNGTTTAQVSDGTGTTTAWNQIQQSGDKIAEITINNTTTDVYVPQAQGGHTYVDSSGTAMTARSKAKYIGTSKLEDDNANNTTKIKTLSIVECTETQYANKSTAEKNEPTDFFATDDDDEDFNLGDLNDMNLGTPQDGDYPAWNSNNSKYELVHAHGIVELWENPNIGTDYLGGSFQVSSNVQYDSLWFEVSRVRGEVLSPKVTAVDKGVSSTTFTEYSVGKMDNAEAMIWNHYERSVTISYDATTHKYTFTFTNATAISKVFTSTTASTPTTNNSLMIPCRILGLIHND